MPRSLSLRKHFYAKQIGYDFFSHLYFRLQSLVMHNILKRGLRLRAFRLYLRMKFYLKHLDESEPHILIMLCFVKIAPKIYVLQIKKRSRKINIPTPISFLKRTTTAVLWLFRFVKESKYNINPLTLAKLIYESIYKKNNLTGYFKKYLLDSLTNIHLIKWYLK